MSEKIIKWNNQLLAFNNSYIRTEVVTPPAPTYPTDGLIERWTFDNDMDGLNGNNFVNDNGTIAYTTDSPGATTKCLSFDGATSNQRIKCTASDVYNTFVNKSAYSVSLWIKNTNTSGFPKLLSTGDTRSGQPYQPLIELNSGSSKITAGRLRPAVEFESIASTVDVFGENIWQHVVYTYDSGYHKLYIDNTLDASLYDSATFDLAPTQIAIGYNVSDWPLSGYISLYYLYNKALSTDEISTLYNSGEGV